MSYSDSIANSIAFLAKNSTLNDVPITTIVGSITQINNDSDGNPYAVVTPLDPNLNQIGYVQLSPNNSSLNFVPSVGSRVTVSLFDENSGYIAQFGAVSSVSLAPGNTSYSGMCIVGDVTTKLNNLESTVNDLRTILIDLINQYNTHTHMVSSFGSPSTTTSDPNTDMAPSALTLTQATDIENPNVIHGNGIPDDTIWYNNVQLQQGIIADQQILVQTALNNISTFINSNPGQQIPAALTTNYQQQYNLLQQAEQNYINLTSNPPH